MILEKSGKNNRAEIVSSRTRRPRGEKSAVRRWTYFSPGGKASDKTGKAEHSDVSRENLSDHHCIYKRPKHSNAGGQSKIDTMSRNKSHELTKKYPT